MVFFIAHAIDYFNALKGVKLKMWKIILNSRILHFNKYIHFNTMFSMKKIIQLESNIDVITKFKWLILHKLSKKILSIL